MSSARTASKAASAASMPLRIARWMPFSRIEFTKFAASPTIRPPSMKSRGWVFQPPSGSAFAPYFITCPPSSMLEMNGCSLKRWNAE